MTRRYVYLGRSVEDTGRSGLDSLREVEDIADEIIEDCVEGEIPYKKAMSRMNLLELVVAKSKVLRAKGLRGRAREIVDQKREELRERCGSSD